jgi:hypothetical protein
MRSRTYFIQDDSLCEVLGRENLRQETAGCFSLLKTGEAIIMRVITFTDIKKCLEQTFQSGASVIFRNMGKGCGMRSCKRFKQKYQDKTLVLKTIQKHKKAERWGNIQFNLNLKTGVGTVRITQSFEAKEYGESQNPVCYFFAGYLEGVLSELFESEMKVTETRCIAKGDDHCEFVVTYNQLLEK